MDCISVDDILSTTVLYEGFFNYNEFFKISKESVKRFLSITNKYKDNCMNSDLEKKEIYLEDSNEHFSREFIYKFNDYVKINKMKYSSFNRELIYYEIYEILDFKNDIERLILFGSYIGKDKDFIEIFLNEVKVKNIKIKLVNKMNVWPSPSEIIFEKYQ